MSEYREPSAELRARVAMEKYRFQTTHSLGQNFILDDRFIDHLLDAAGVCASDNVLEIGPGAGVMTSRLAQRARQVLAIEVDKGLEPVLSEVLNGEENVQLVFQDVMKADIDSMVNAAFGGASYRVVANLPYYITADVLLKLVRGERLPESISIMVQKEAAQRIMSAPGQKQWCAMAATLQFYGKPQVLMEVQPDIFYPRPHVTSCFIRLDLYAERPVKPLDEKLFIKLINAAFAMRRKTLANNLKAAFGLSQDKISTVLSAAEIDQRTRGESLSLEELCRIADGLKNVL